MTLDAIEAVFDRAKFTEVQRRMMWQRVANKLIEAADLRQEIDESAAGKMAEEVVEEERKLEDIGPAQPG